MKNEIELPIEGNSKLRIIVGLNDWSQCFLKTDDKQISLGADAIGIIATRLMQNLNRQNERIAGYHQGYELHFVLTLSETHNTLYCAFDQDGRILFWQDKWAKWFWSGRLSHKEYETWCKRLEKLC